MKTSSGFEEIEDKFEFEDDDGDDFEQGKSPGSARRDAAAGDLRSRHAWSPILSLQSSSNSNSSSSSIRASSFFKSSRALPVVCSWLRAPGSWLLTSWTVRCLLPVAMCVAQRTPGQWIPPAALRHVPVLADCHLTKRGVGVSLQANLFYPHGAIFLCPEREREIDRRRPGASRFFLIHEYGHLAMHSREEAVADVWAAKQLASVPAERGTLRAVILYFADEGTLFDPLYGTGFDRAWRVARAADIPERNWPLPLVIYAQAQEALRATGTALTLRVQSGYSNAAQMVICVDREPIGVLSNMDGKGRLELPRLVPGPHLIQALQVWLYHIEPSGVKSEVARNLQAECRFDSTGKQTIVIELRFDGDTLSIRANELH